jgi:hypothetical protein
MVGDFLGELVLHGSALLTWAQGLLPDTAGSRAPNAQAPTAHERCAALGQLRTPSVLSDDPAIMH